MDGTTLSYIIRDNDTPDAVLTLSNINEECIARVPLNGVAYEADA